jgi:hypothetical protein
VLYCRAYNGNGSNSLRRRCLYDRGVLIRSKVGSMFALISGHSCSVNSLSSSLAPSRAAGLERRSTARCRTMVSCQPLKKSGLQQNAATREPWSNARRRSPTCAEVVSDDTELAAPLRIQIPLPGAIAFRKMLGFPLRRHGRLQFPVACCLLPVACCLLPVACCLLPSPAPHVAVFVIASQAMRMQDQQAWSFALESALVLREQGARCRGTRCRTEESGVAAGWRSSALDAKPMLLRPPRHQLRLPQRRVPCASMLRLPSACCVEPDTGVAVNVNDAPLTVALKVYLLSRVRPLGAPRPPPAWPV